MPNTPGVEHPYPEKHQDPFYDAFVAFAKSIDAADHAARDQRNLAVMPTGTLSVGPSGTVTWSAKLALHHALTGILAEIPTAASGVQLADGQTAYTEVVRAPQGAYEASLTVTSGDVPDSDRAVAMFQRIGALVWVRGAGILRLGQTLRGSTAPLVTAADTAVDSRRLAGREQVGPGRTTIGRISMAPDNRSYVNASTTVEWSVQGELTDQSDTGTIYLYDAKAKTDLHTLQISTEQPTRKEVADVGFVDPGDVRPYEVQAGVQTGAAGELILYDSGLTFRHSF